MVKIDEGIDRFNKGLVYKQAQKYNQYQVWLGHFPRCFRIASAKKSSLIRIFQFFLFFLITVLTF